MKNIIQLLIISVLSSLYLLAKDIEIEKLNSIIIMNDDTSIYCNIIDEKDDYYLVQMQDSSIEKKYKNNIVSISKNPIYNNTGNTINPGTINGFIPKQNNTLIGGTLLNPGGVNLVYGVIDNNFGLRANLGWIPGSIFGAQFDLMIPFYYAQDVYFAFSPIIGYSSFAGKNSPFDSSNETWAYVGGLLNLNIYGFDFTGGLNAFSSSVNSPQLLLSVGYVHRLR
jgi:hypothetical protein